MCYPIQNYSTPERMVLAAPGAVTHPCELFSSIDKGFDFSLTGAFNGSVILECHYGDEELGTLQTYTAPAEDYGTLSSARLIVRVRALSDFAGEAKILIVQTGRMYDHE